MPVSIIPIGKTNPSNPDNPLSYYPMAVKNNVIDLDDLAKQISNETTLTAADCYAVIIALVQSVSGQLENGNIVRLGHLGSFQISVHGEGSATPEEVTPSKVKKASVLFRPGKQFKQMLTELRYVRKK